MEQYDSSPEMKRGKKELGFAKGVAFDKIEVGKSVILNITDVEEKTLRVTVSQMSKKLGKKFRCVKHINQGIFELGRLPDKMEEPEPLQQWDSSPQMKGE